VKQILHYFPALSPNQIKQFEALEELYKFWNEQINVISRKDTENFYERHVLHSLGIAKIQTFEPGSEILDVGTGGGFPGIPLAILFPESNFTLVDSIGKKIKVVNEVAKAIGLTNVKGIHSRAEQVEGKFDFVVSRAVTRMPDFLVWVKGKIKSKSNHERKNGILYLKGGDLTEEMSTVKQKYKEFLLSDIYSEEFFETKKVIHVVI
jgi:16S rRNA (guanine527-N7)-methyltransferase